MSRILAASFGATQSAVKDTKSQTLSLLDALDTLTWEQREVMARVVREFAGAVKKPRKGAAHRTRDLLAFLSSPDLLDWFTPNQLHQLAGAVAIAAYQRTHETRQAAAEVR